MGPDVEAQPLDVQDKYALETEVIGQLSDPVGDLIWERREVSTGGPSLAVRELLFRLARDVGCTNTELLERITTILVQGRGRAATRLRKQLGKGKTCLQLAENRDEADAVLKIEEGAEHRSILGNVEVAVFGTLTVPTGEVIWNRKEKPFGADAVSSADRLLRRLAKDCKCKQRKKRQK